MSRVSKNNILVVESYKNSAELFNMQCWSLTCGYILKAIRMGNGFLKKLIIEDYTSLYFLNNFNILSEVLRRPGNFIFLSFNLYFYFI